MSRNYIRVDDGEQDKAAVLVVGRSAACVLVTTIENE
jgi:hypothetical protein